jgi:hypothetical protein
VRIATAAAAAVSGALLLAVPSASAASAGSPYPAEMAFQANTGDLWEACTADSDSGCTGGETGGLNPIDTGLAMAAGTSPSIAYTLIDGGKYEVAFQGSNGDLWTTGIYGTTDTGLRVMPGTSPAIAQIAAGGDTFVIAFEDVDAELVTYELTPTTTSITSSKETTAYLGLPVATNSSPAITPEPGNGYTIAYQNSAGYLSTTGTLGTGSPGLGMKAGTSPSITLVTGGYQIAFQANTGELWTYGTLGTGDLGRGMDNSTSPSIAMIGDAIGGAPEITSNYEIAFQANTGHLWTIGSAGLPSGDLGQAMKPGTSPSIVGTNVITVATSGSPSTLKAGYIAAYQSSTGVLSFYDELSGQAFSTGLGMDNSTSPGTAHGYGSFDY